MKLTFCDNDDDVRFELDKLAKFYRASSLKQQSAGRHVAPLGYVILNLNHPVFALTSYCCVLCGEAANANFDPTGTRTHDLPHSRQVR